VAFDNRKDAEVDLTVALEGPIFTPFKDLHYFAKLSVDPELETTVWPNGVDLATEIYMSYITNKHRSRDFSVT
jgi:hypothetical protein